MIQLFNLVPSAPQKAHLKDCSCRYLFYKRINYRKSTQLPLMDQIDSIQMPKVPTCYLFQRVGFLWVSNVHLKKKFSFSQMYLILFSTYNNVFQHLVKSRCMLHLGQLQKKKKKNKNKKPSDTPISCLRHRLQTCSF